MNLCAFVLLCALCVAKCDWIQDLTRSDGLRLGGGINLRLQTNLTTNSSRETPLDKYGLEFDYQSLGVSVRKVPGRDVLQVGLFYKDEEQGRSKKMGEALFPIVMGFKVTGLIAITLAGITIFVTKAFLFAKLALMLSLGYVVSKFMHNDQPYEHYEFDHHPPDFHSYYDYPSAAGFGEPPHSYGYANYGTYGYSTTGEHHEPAAESSGQYSVATPSNGTTGTSAESEAQRQSAGKRLDPPVRRRVQLLPAYITVKEFTIEH